MKEGKLEERKPSKLIASIQMNSNYIIKNTILFENPEFSSISNSIN